MAEELVSIIVPAYNVLSYIKKCVKTLEEQTYHNLEIVIVDDGSDDGTAECCDEIAKLDKRIIVYHKKNGGLSEARNMGIKKAHGEYVALVDGDDCVEKNFIEELMGAMRDDDSDVAICGYDNVVPTTKLLSGKEAATRLLIKQENLEIVAWNKLYRKKLFKNIQYPVGEKYEDTLTTYKILAQAQRVSYIGKSLYHYVKRAGSIMSNTKVEEQLVARERAAEEAMIYFEDQDLFEAAKVSLLMAKYAWVDAGIRGDIPSEVLEKNLQWIRQNQKSFDKNKMMTSKLKLYNFLVKINGYKLFRTII